MDVEFTLDLPGFLSEAAYVVGPYSRQIDTHAPACDLIMMPARVLPGRKVPIRRFRGVSSPENLSRKGRARRLIGKAGPSTPSDRVMVDLRFYSPGNWSHYLNDHIPNLIYAIGQFGLSRDDVHIVLPLEIARHIRQVTELLGFSFTCTDADVTGEFLEIERKSFSQLRSMLRQIVTTSGAVQTLLDQTSALNRDLPEKVFLARRGQRAIENEAEVAAFLATQGFVKVYGEDYSTLEQIALFQRARQIIGIHGAGLAPILYVDPARPPEFLIEIFPPCMAIDCFKSMAQQAGVYWTAVRGRLKPEFVTEIYSSDLNLRSRIMDNFAVDVQSLELALALAKARELPRIPQVAQPELPPR